jgi:Flp pilus assembly protein TadD
MQDKSTVKDKLIPSYRYMVAYYYNIKGQADTALMYNNKILEVDPTDALALKTKDALESVIKNQAKAAAANKPSDSTKPKQ